jgi:addiction module RelE/StbE family toxin
MRVLWTRLARRDVNGIWDYIDRDNPMAAELVESRILASIANLEQYPRSGRLGRVRGPRELIIPASPYIVVYAAEELRIVILRVIHGAMDWPGDP